MDLRVKELLKEKGVTTYQLAEYLGVTQPAISNAMNGNPTVNWLRSVAKFLNVEVGELFTPSNGAINGFIEVDGIVYRVRSYDDLRKILALEASNK